MTTLLYWRRQVKPAGNQKNTDPITPMRLSHPYDLIIGLDRADKKADLCLLNTATDERQFALIDTSPGLYRC
jgi:hypothetical protein